MNLGCFCTKLLSADIRGIHCHVWLLFCFETGSLYVALVGLKSQCDLKHNLLLNARHLPLHSEMTFFEHHLSDRHCLVGAHIIGDICVQLYSDPPEIKDILSSFCIERNQGFFMLSPHFVLSMGWRISSPLFGFWMEGMPNSFLSACLLSCLLGGTGNWTYDLLHSKQAKSSLASPSVSSLYSFLKKILLRTHSWHGIHYAANGGWKFTAILLPQTPK